MPKTPFKVFYSWQSDMSEHTHKLLIRTALTEAASAVTADPNSEVVVSIDEAITERTGSPDIAASIFDKIRTADAFVCDITTITETVNPDGTKRRFCNPNVAIEFGYAIRVLGWDRVYSVFNKADGMKPEDLPFDVRGRFSIGYTCKGDFDAKGKPTPACTGDIKNAVGNLKAFFVRELQQIAQKNPPRPQLAETKSPAEIRRERDVAQLKAVLRCTPPHLLDYFIERLSFNRLTFSGMDFCDYLDNVVQASGYHFNDPKLGELVANLHRAWNRCLRFSIEMDTSNNGQELHFHMPGDVERSHRQGRLCKRLPMTAGPFSVALKAFLTYVKENYLEIDVAAIEREAVVKYREISSPETPTTKKGNA